MTLAIQINKHRTTGLLLALALAFALAPAFAAPKDDFTNRKSEWDKLKSRMGDVTGKVEAFLEKSRKLREMDKTELDSLITQVCRVDIARSGDKGEETAKSIEANIVAKVRSEYDNINAEGDRLGGGEVERVLNDAKSLRDNTKGLTSFPETKDDTERLLREMSDAIDAFTSRTYQKFTDDYRTLTNLKNGTMNGSNNARIRAAMEYGKEKHTYNQRICEEKEVVLSSGRPDCVSFNKNACAVWEFKPDTYSTSDAESQARGYIRDVQEKFKSDPRAIANCEKTSDGLPKFEAKVALYPACRP